MPLATLNRAHTSLVPRPHFSSPPKWSDDPGGEDVAIFVDPDIQPVHFCSKSR